MLYVTVIGELWKSVEISFLAIGNFYEKKEAPGGVLLKRYS